MAFTAHVTGDRVMVVMADDGEEVSGDVAGAAPFRGPDGRLFRITCDDFLTGLGFRRTGEWQPYATESGAGWMAEVSPGERMRFQMAVHQMRGAFLCVKDELESLKGHGSLSQENGDFFDGYAQAKRIFGDVLLQRDAHRPEGFVSAPARD